MKPNNPEFSNALRNHISECALGMIGGKRQPYGILIHELEKKIISDIDAAGSDAESLHKYRMQTLSDLQKAQEKHLRNDRAVVGGNNPPDPIDEICAQFEGLRGEAENWLDGHEVTNEAQMKAVDDLRKGARQFRMALEAGMKSATAPLYDAYKAEGARWKPTVEDAQRIEKGLVALVDAFKRKLAAIKAEAERKAREEAEAARRAAERAAREASAADIEALRSAAQAQLESEEAQRRAAAASKDTVKGLRTYDVTEVMDGTAYARWLWMNDREPLLAWMEDHARRCKHHIPGVVETRKEKRAV